MLQKYEKPGKIKVSSKIEIINYSITNCYLDIFAKMLHKIKMLVQFLCHQMTTPTYVFFFNWIISRELNRRLRRDIRRQGCLDIRIIRRRLRTSFKSRSAHVLVGFRAFREWLWSTRLNNVSACEGRWCGRGDAAGRGISRRGIR